MKYEEELIAKLKKFIIGTELRVYRDELKGIRLTFSELRDKIIGKGKILDEDFECQIYTINISSGIANMNSAIVAIKLYQDTIEMVGYAKEGVIFQYTAERAIIKLRRIINDE